MTKLHSVSSSVARREVRAEAEACARNEIPVVDGAASMSMVAHSPALHEIDGAGHENKLSGSGSCRVLVVDDQPDMTSMMQLMLTRRGYRVATASSAQRAIETALDFQPDLIISDIGMPDMDGYAMMRALRAEKTLPAFKAIALTGFGLPADQQRACGAGFDFCLVKPLDFATFFGCIEKVLEQRSRPTADDMAAASCLHTTSELRPSFDSSLEPAGLSLAPTANASR